MKRILFFSLIFLTSCLQDTKTLPSSTGSLSEVVFVVSNDIWQEKIKAFVDETFASPIEGLSQKEACFRVIHIEHYALRSILKKHKNIVIIAKDIQTSSQKDKWANGQLVVQLNYKEEHLRKNLIKIKSMFQLEELRSIKNKISLRSQELYQNNIFNNFSINLLIPYEYTVIKDTSTLFWAMYNPDNKEAIKQLLVFSFTPLTSNIRSEILLKTDSVFSKYLKGAKEGQYVKIEYDFPPYYINETYRGLWKLEKGFMGGPFLIKTYFIDDKIVVNVGLIFAPQSRKRSYIKELEAIL